MTSLVLDCSVAISWFMPDEANNYYITILEQVAEKGAVVPSIWHLEVGNVLLNAERNKRITPEQVGSAIYSLNELPIITDSLTSKNAWQETMELAKYYNLSLYDASYLELAQRLNIPIATFDKQLKIAAKKKNITMITE